jgi:LPXTG-motif cell wall-anchored protein
VPPSRLLAVLASLAMLAFPAAGFAQSAGDDQYGDPLGPQQEGGSTAPGGGGSSGTAPPPSNSSGAPAPAPAPTAAAPSTGTVGSTTAGAPTAPGTLPNTGASPMLIAFFGVAMVLMGTGAMLAVPRRE